MSDTKAHEDEEKKENRAEREIPQLIDGEDQVWKKRDRQ